jgi:hypothetical protein
VIGLYRFYFRKSLRWVVRHVDEVEHPLKRIGVELSTRSSDKRGQLRRTDMREAE